MYLHTLCIFSVCLINYYDKDIKEDNKSLKMLLGIIPFCKLDLGQVIQEWTK